MIAVISIGLVAFGPAVARPGPSAETTAGGAAGAERQGEVRDALLLLDGGPLHVRLEAMLDGISLREARQNYVDRLIATLDRNGDGQLTREEANRSPLLARKRRESAREFIQSLKVVQKVGRRKIEEMVQRVGGESVVYRQDTSSADTDLEVFKFLDKDGSGHLDRTEIALAAERIMARDTDRDDCVSFREFLPEPEPNANPLVVALPDGDPEGPIPVFARMLRDTNEPLLPRALLRRYDEDGDGRLSADELGWSSERIGLLDKNGDRLVDETELKHVEQLPVDLHLAVELAAGDEQASRRLQPTDADPEADASVSPDPEANAPGSPVGLRIISTTGDRLDGGARSDYARIAFPGTLLTLSFRRVDPIPAALEQAMRVFNELDADANGYLDEEETDESIRFRRGLFDAIDFDGDGKVFGEEMERYVRGRCGPAATSCRVNLHDTGRGFFQALDLNGDGRISIREMRTADESLAGMNRDAEPGLTPEEPTRHFHIEFVRGSFQLFGRNDQMIARGPTFEQYIPVGPVWFQRMDRNNDGDLTWNEFLGSRIDFERLDADRDGLIDPQEAEAAGSQ